ncbi:cache domain-containing protein [Methylobacterium phyllosphaerae]
MQAAAWSCARSWAMLKAPLLGMLLLSLSMTPCEPDPGDDEDGVHQAAEIEALVQEASDILKRQGHRAFAGFRMKNSHWRHADVYLFVTDMRGVILFNAEHPDHEGRNLLDERDADGKQFRKDFIAVVRGSGSGWVDYMFPRPGQTVPVVKWGYVSETCVDEIPALVGAGVYVD